MAFRLASDALYRIMNRFPVEQEKAEYQDKETHPKNRPPGLFCGTGMLFFRGSFWLCPLPYCHIIMIRRRAALGQAGGWAGGAAKLDDQGIE
jgi:hypothetical protein